MFNNKYLKFTFLFILFIVSIGAVSAAENSTVDDVVSIDSDSNIDVNEISDVNSNLGEKSQSVVDENSNQNYKHQNENPTVLKEDSNISTGTFTDLYTLINNTRARTTINLTRNYTYNNDTDSNLSNGITFYKSVIINGNGFTIDANHQARIFSFSGRLTNLNLINAYGTGFWYGRGAAVSSDMTLINCTFRNNHGYTGGAVAFSGTGSAINCTFINNSADSGGAMAISSRSKIINCTFINNTAGYGGAIANSGHPTIDNCVFIGNHANSTISGFGGGAISVSAAVNITNSLFINNSANEGGAAVGGRYINCSFINNSAKQHGGAIGLYGSACNSTFIGNNASEGGSLYTFGSGVVFENNTFSFNRATEGGAVYFRNNATLANSIFNNNTATRGGAIYASRFSSNSLLRNLSIINNSATYGSAIYNERTFTVINSTMLDNQAESTRLDLRINRGTLIISFTGKDNQLNGIYSTSSLIPDNFTYWGKDGINTISQDTYYTNKSMNESGIDIVLRIYDINNNIVSEKIYTTDENGQVFINTSSFPYRYANITATLKNDTYYTYISNHTVYDNRLDAGDAVIPNITYGTEDIILVFSDNVTGNVTVVYNNVSYPGDIVDRKVNLHIGLNAAKENYTTLVTYSGDSNYNSFADRNVNFTIFKASPVLDIGGFNITYGEIEDININITGIRNWGLNATVTVSSDIFNGTVSTVDGSGQISIENLKPGNYSINAVFEGDENYTSANSTYVFNVAKATPVITVETNDITYGEDETVNVTVTGVNDTPLNGTVNINDQNVTIVDGKGTVTLSNLKADDYTVTAVFEGNENYTSADTTGSFNVAKATPVITVETNDITYGEDETVNVTVTGVNDTPLNGTVNINDQNVTIVDGKGTVTLSNLKADDYTVTAVFGGDENYTSADTTGSFNVAKATPVINIESNDIVYGEDETVNVTVTGVNDTPLNGTVNINDQTITIVDGKGSIIVYGPAVGSHDIGAEFTGDENYNPADNSTVFNVDKAVPSVVVESENVTYGGDVIANVTVTGINGTPLNGTANILNQTINITDGMGQLILTRPDSGVYDITTVYEGNENYTDSSSDNTSVTVFKAPTKVILKTDIVSIGKNYMVDVNLTDQDGNPIENGTVNLKIRNKNYKVSITNGTGSILINDVAPGTHNITASFEGNENYLESENNTSITFNQTKKENNNTNNHTENNNSKPSTGNVSGDVDSETIADNESVAVSGTPETGNPVMVLFMVLSLIGVVGLRRQN